jgi:hypothetical protein
MRKMWVKREIKQRRRVMKNVRNFVVLFSIVVGGIAANAQTSFKGTFQLTSATRWDNAVLPAGHYSLTLGSVKFLGAPAGVIVIHSEDWKVSAMALAKFSAQAAAGGSYILITGSGNDRLVRSMNLPQLGRSLVFKPMTRRERETLYTNASQTVPVQIAKK